MLWVLAGIDLVVAGSAHFPYPHLLLPSIPWVCAAVVATPWNRWNVLVPLARPRLSVGSAVLAAGILLAAAEGSYAGSFWINGRSLSTYYADGYSSLVNATERTRWQNSFSDSIVVDQVVTHWLMAHHYAHASAVVWSVADEWVYLLTPLHTLLPTVSLFNDDVLLGDRSKIGTYVDRHRPVVIITNQPSVALRSSILTVVAQWYIAGVPLRHGHDLRRALARLESDDGFRARAAAPLSRLNEGTAPRRSHPSPSRSGGC